MSNFINHSGGANGADMTWEIVGKEYGVKTNAYGFSGHTNKSDNPVILTTEQLLEGWAAAQIANEVLDRNLKGIEFNPYVRNLICRNWYQVKNSEAVYAIGSFRVKYYEVNGGTGWAVQMAIDNGVPLYFFDQIENQWYKYLVKFEPIEYTPTLKRNFAGIGTRDINDFGIQAIIDVYKRTFRDGKDII